MKVLVDFCLVLVSFLPHLNNHYEKLMSTAIRPFSYNLVLSNIF
jgi:hypothetical protein